ncbi:hypothetical protein MHU86_14940 [Fragilaria crotonensis]|nr:hypothetical protein MHU86_14940 [Fragilaria crotonensis]
MVSMNYIRLNTASLSTLKYSDSVDVSAIPSVPTVQQSQHCVIVSSRLYGYHTERRRRHALDGYRHATFNSNLLAARYSNLSAIMVVLKSRESYEHEYVHDTDTLGGRVTFFQLRGAVIINKEFATKRQCQFMSVMALDADDILLPAAFQNIEMGWRHVLSSHNYGAHATLDGHSFPNALLSGVPLIEFPQLTLHPVSPDGSKLKCTLAETKRPAHFVNAEVFIPASQGNHYHAPGDWLSQFGADDRIMAVNHVFQWERAIPQLDAGNIRIHFQILGLNHSAWLVTPLPSHYKAPRRQTTSPCNRTYLAELYGKQGGEMLWANRQFVPKLTLEEWESNALVKTKERVWLRPVERWNARSNWSS